MSDLHIDMTSGKTINFYILDNGWLDGNIEETLLDIEDPEPDFTGRKPSRIYRADTQLTKAEWIEIDYRLQSYFRGYGFPDALFGFGEVLEKTSKSVKIYNSKTEKTFVMFFEGDTIIEVKLVGKN